MVENISGYHISVDVKSLDDVTKVITFLKDAGFVNVSFYTSRPAEIVEEEREQRAKVRYKNIILLALNSAKAQSEESAIDVDRIITIGREHISEVTARILGFDNQGIARRTINMIATVILADKNGYINYTTSDPKKFWLTAKGIENMPIVQGVR